MHGGSSGYATPDTPSRHVQSSSVMLLLLIPIRWLVIFDTLGIYMT